MIADLAADRLASLTAQRYTGGALPVPVDRLDAIRLVVAVNELSQLKLSADGPRVRLETVSARTWPASRTWTCRPWSQAA